MNKFKKKLTSILSRGYHLDIQDFVQFETLSKIKFINITCIIAIVLFAYFTIAGILRYEPIFHILFTTGMFVFTIINFLVLNISKKHDLAGSIIILIMMITSCETVSYGAASIKDYTIFFTFCYPVLVFYLKEKKPAIYWLIPFFGFFVIYILLIAFKIVIANHSLIKLVFVTISLAIISILLFFYENKKQKIIELVQKQIYTDLLTHLGNRRKLVQDIVNSNSKQLILLNIDGFREINDIFGNVTGDSVLIKIKDILLENLDQNSYRCYKLHADEFAVLPKKTQKKRVLEKTIKDLYEKICHNNFVFNTLNINISLSIGAATHKKNLLEETDMALHFAKNSRSHFAVFEKKMGVKKAYSESLKWGKMLKEAINSGRIAPFFQPIVDNKTGKVTKYECLVRMFDRFNKVISPFYFLNIAKKTKLYPSITRMMVDKSFESFKDLDYEFSINITVEDILNQDIVNFILEKLYNTDISKKLIFEIVESEGIKEFKKVIDFIIVMKNLGCKIAIDDFGSGYSNWEYILKLNVDYLKIDASLIREIDKEVTSQLIVKNIVNFAKSVKIKTIAEYVHSEPVYKMVKKLGIDYSQGFYLGKPTNKF